MISLKLFAVIVVVLVVAFALLRAMIRRQRRRGAPGRAIRKASRSPLTRTQARAFDQAYTVLGPTSVREIEDEIPTIDERGNRRVVIRTRTMETVLGPVGPTEVEKGRRLTLPGHGHVVSLSDTEFEVFRDHLKLRLDTDAARRPRVEK